MNHLVRINMVLCVVDEEELWQADEDYGLISDRMQEEMFGKQVKNPWVEGAAEYLRKKGL